jgi:hypothetical protein
MAAFRDILTIPWLGITFHSEDPPSEGEFDLSRWNQWLGNAETINIRVLVRG